MSHIVLDIEKLPATVYSCLLYHGGIEPKTQVRRSNSLSFEEWETISRGIASGSSMRERPAKIEGRAIPGHWEGDLMIGSIAPLQPS